MIPLFAQGERVGALVVAAHKKLTRSHIDSLGVIADLAGVAFAGAGHFTELERLATTDGLTKLLNRRSLDEKLEEALGRAQRNETPLAVILSDIDHFKSVNDTYGHQVGDDVLVEVAATFAECVRTTDVVARYGGRGVLPRVREHRQGRRGHARGAHSHVDRRVDVRDRARPPRGHLVIRCPA